MCVRKFDDILHHDVCKRALCKITNATCMPRSWNQNGTAIFLSSHNTHTNPYTHHNKTQTLPNHNPQFSLYETHSSQPDRPSFAEPHKRFTTDSSSNTSTDVCATIPPLQQLQPHTQQQQQQLQYNNNNCTQQLQLHQQQQQLHQQQQLQYN
eukprot:gene965-4209_t